MNCRQAYQRKDNSDGKGTEDTNAYRGSDGYRRSGPVLEWRNHLDDRFRTSDRGSGHYRPATDTYELRRSRPAHGQTVRSWRVLLLAPRQSPVCSILFLTQSFSSASCDRHSTHCRLSIGRSQLKPSVRRSNGAPPLRWGFFLHRKPGCAVAGHSRVSLIRVF